MPRSQSCRWSNNNLACVNTWGFLRALKQLRPVFSKSGDIKMSQLAFWNKAAGPDVRRLEAKELAAQLDSIFRKALLAKYEQGFSFSSAVKGMADDLANANKTVCRLSETVDEVYKFNGEIR